VALVVALTDPAAQSVLESQARVLLVLAGLGPVESQVHFERVGWVDFLVQGWLVVEVDGFAVHRDSFREDRRRDAELTRQGLVVLRFTYDDLLRRPEWVLSVVRETLRAGRPRHAA
jgi:very-short-patch-repair endonuclease